MGDARIKSKGIKPEPGIDEGSVMASVVPANSVDKAFADIANANASASRVRDKDKQMVPDINYMDQLVSKTSADELEAGVALGLQLLNSLKVPLRATLATTNTTKAATWLKAIQHLQDTAKPSRTVVGVVSVVLPNNFDGTISDFD